MLSLKTLKDKLYWILLPPFLIATALLLIFLPDEYRHTRAFLPLAFIVSFWSVYHILKYHRDKRENNREN